MTWTYPSELTAGAGVRLRLAGTDDAGTITAWLRDERVHRWWGGSAVPEAEVLEKYTGRRLPAVVVYVVEAAGRPVGLLQAWRRHEPAGVTCGLDMFVAAGAQGRGLGPRAARALAEDLHRRGWRNLTVDPGADNPRAVRAWGRAGFVPADDRGTDRPGGDQLMVHVPCEDA